MDVHPLALTFTGPILCAWWTIALSFCFAGVRAYRRQLAAARAREAALSSEAPPTDPASPPPHF